MSTKRKFPAKLAQPTIKPSAKQTANESLNDSRAIVSSGISSEKVSVNGTTDTIEISSDSSSDEEEEEEDGNSEEDEAVALPTTPDGDDVDMRDVDDQHQYREEHSPDADDAEEQAEPSFGDLVLANTSEPIDVAGAFNDSNVHTLEYPHSKKLQPPSGASLGTVLTQALKTNDLILLESCLQTPDINTIRATIQRLDSPLAGSLLQKIAERLHRRPGRAGSLMVWVQWTLVTHGGYLATQPDLIRKLAELNRVIDERARGLQSLLSLKGKLDMLEAQMQLRQSMRQQRHDVDDEDEDDPGVIYVEGEEESSSAESEDKNTATSVSNGKTKSTIKSARAAPNGKYSDNDSEASELMPNVVSNGAIADSDASEEESEGNLIDDEAEETDADSDDEDDVDHSDVDEMDEEDESDDAAPARSAPPTKLQKLGALFSKGKA